MNDAVVRELIAAAQEIIDLWDSDRLEKNADFDAFTQKVVEFSLRSDAAKARLRAAVVRALEGAE